MKHFFHIHSNINLITAIALIEENNLPVEDVVLFLARNIETEYPGIKKVVLEDWLYYNAFAKKRLMFTLKQDLKVIRTLDKMIDKHREGQDFTYYSPHSRNAFYTIFLTHKKCVQVHYIEDGMDNYLSVDGLEKKYPREVPIGHVVLDIFYSLFFFLKFNRLRSYDDIYRSIGNEESILYGIGTNSYKNQEPWNKKVKILDIRKVKFFDQYQITDAIFVFDAVEEQKVVPGEVLDKLIHWFGKYYRDQIEELAIKFHPYQSADHRNRIIGIFEQYLKVKLVDDSVLLECAFARAKDLKVFGMGSSLLNYAYELNSTNTVEILYPYFKDQENYVSSRLPIWEDCFRNNERIRLSGRDFDYTVNQ